MPSGQLTIVSQIDLNNKSVVFLNISQSFFYYIIVLFTIFLLVSKALNPNPENYPGMVFETEYLGQISGQH